MTDHIERALAALAIETPSWGYGDSGTRFGMFQQPGRPRDVFERLDDAAEVHRLTGAAPAVALHFPWDAGRRLRRAAASTPRSAACASAPSTRTCSRTPTTSSARSRTPTQRVRHKAVEHLLECVEIARELGSTAQSLWFADGTNYPGQDDLRARRRRMIDSLARVYEALPAEQELLVEYKLFEPAFYATDLADWGSALLTCQKLGERARVLVDLGHHAQGVNIEQIVAILADEGRLGGFHFNNRKYADDDLIVGSVNPFELFLIFVELAASDELPRLTIDQAAQRRGEGRGDGAERRQPPGGLRQGAARRPRRAGARRRRRATCSRGHEFLLDAYQHRRAPAVRQGARGGRRRRGSGRRLPRVGLRRAHRRRARIHRDRGRRVGPMSIARPDDRPRRGPLARGDRGARTTRSARCCSPRTCSAPTARWRTSAAATRRPRATATDHVGREVAGHVGQGLGHRPRDDGAQALHAAAARRDAAAVRARRDVRRGHGRPPRALPDSTRRRRAPRSRRCCTRSCPADARPPHAPGRDQRARRHARRRAARRASASATRRRGSRTSARASRSPSRSAPRCARTRACKLVVLAKHGLVVWGDSAEEAYRRTIEVINQAADFVNARTEGMPRFGGAARRGPGRPGAPRRPPRGAAGAARRGVERAPQGARRRHLAARRSSSSSSREAPELVTVGAACPDHLVHTKRVPLWIPFDPASEDADALRARIARARRARTATTTARTSTRHGDEDDRAGRPRRARGADPARRAGRRGADDQERARCRATSTTGRSR